MIDAVLCDSHAIAKTATGHHICSSQFLAGYLVPLNKAFIFF